MVTDPHNISLNNQTSTFSVGEALQNTFPLFVWCDLERKTLVKSRLSHVSCLKEQDTLSVHYVPANVETKTN